MSDTMLDLFHAACAKHIDVARYPCDQFLICTYKLLNSDTALEECPELSVLHPHGCSELYLDNKLLARLIIDYRPYIPDTKEPSNFSRLVGVDIVDSKCVEDAHGELILFRIINLDDNLWVFSSSRAGCEVVKLNDQNCSELLTPVLRDLRLRSHTELLYLSTITVPCVCKDDSSVIYFNTEGILPGPNDLPPSEYQACLTAAEFGLPVTVLISDRVYSHRLRSELDARSISSGDQIRLIEGNFNSKRDYDKGFSNAGNSIRLILTKTPPAPAYYGLFPLESDIRPIASDNKLSIHQKTPLHVTVLFVGGSTNKNIPPMPHLLNKVVDVQIIGYSISEAGQCLVTSQELPGNHITLSTNMTFKPVDVGKQITSENTHMFQAPILVKAAYLPFF
jgi:hypothetical protein